MRVRHFSGRVAVIKCPRGPRLPTVPLLQYSKCTPGVPEVDCGGATLFRQALVGGHRVGPVDSVRPTFAAALPSGPGGVGPEAPNVACIHANCSGVKGHIMIPLLAA